MCFEITVLLITTIPRVPPSRKQSDCEASLVTAFCAGGVPSGAAVWKSGTAPPPGPPRQSGWSRLPTHHSTMTKNTSSTTPRSGLVNYSRFFFVLPTGNDTYQGPWTIFSPFLSLSLFFSLLSLQSFLPLPEMIFYSVTARPPTIFVLHSFYHYLLFLLH